MMEEAYKASVTPTAGKVFSPMEERIITAFIAICHESGVESVSFQRVADRSGVSFSSVRYHFAGDDRTNLTDAASLYVIQKAYLFIEEKLNEARRKYKSPNLVRAYLQTMLSWIQASRAEATFLLYFYYLNATKRKTPVSADLVFSTGIHRIRSLLHESIGNASLPPLSGIDDLARAIQQIVQGACVTAGTNFQYKQQESIAWNNISGLIHQNTVRLN